MLLCFNEFYLMSFISCCLWVVCSYLVDLLVPCLMVFKLNGTLMVFSQPPPHFFFFFMLCLVSFLFKFLSVLGVL